MTEVSQEKNKGGRPTDFTKELGDSICEQMSTGSSLRAICRKDEMPGLATVFRWLREKEEFRDQYEAAARERSQAQREEIIEIADDGTNDWMEDQYMKGKSPGWKVNGEAVQRSKLRVDTRKWLMSKMEPKKYADKLDLTSNGEEMKALTITGMNIIKDENPVQDQKPEAA